jgi:hypothetical protein
MAKSKKRVLLNPAYFISKMEFMQTANHMMPDELLQFIMDWDNIKVSPYGNNSYYNNIKDWHSFVDGGIRVSNHWNFYTNGGLHCKTVIPIENNAYWYVGVYSSTTDTYDIITKYPIILRSKSNFIKSKLAEYNPIFYANEIALGRLLKQKILLGELFAYVNSPMSMPIKVQVTKLKHKDGVKFIYYYNGDILVNTNNFELI